MNSNAILKEKPAGPESLFAGMKEPSLSYTAADFRKTVAEAAV